MVHEDKKITISMSPEVYRDLRNIAIIRYMTGAMQNSVADEFLVKLLKVMDKGHEEYVFRYADKDYDASLPDGKGIAPMGATSGTADCVQVEDEEDPKLQGHPCQVP